MAVSLELAISAIRAGRKAEGRQLLNLLIQKNPNNAQAWLWMSSVVDSEQQRARCLYHVLSIEPDSKLARRGLKILGVEVSDTRPVKINSRVFQPAQLPPPAAADKKETDPPVTKSKPAPKARVQDEPQPHAEPGAEKAAEAQPEAPESEDRRPFLIDPRRVTEELPFTPLRPPFAPAEPIQASPAILSIDVEKVGATNGHRSAISENRAVAQTKTEPMSEQKAAAPQEAPDTVAAEVKDKPAQQSPAASAAAEIIENTGPDSIQEEAESSTKTVTTGPESATATGSNPLKTQKLLSLAELLASNTPQSTEVQQQRPAAGGVAEATPRSQPPLDPRTVETQKLHDGAPSMPPRTVTRPSQPVPVAANSNITSDPYQTQQAVSDEQLHTPAAQPLESTPIQPTLPPATGPNQGQTQQPAPGTAYHQMSPANSQGANPSPGPAVNGSSPDQTRQDSPPPQQQQQQQQQAPQQPYNDPNVANPPPETRPAQPILINYPPPNPSGPPLPQQSYYYGNQPSPGQANETMPMPHPNQQPPQHGQSTQPMPPPGQHAPANMGGHPQQHNDYYRPPSEPVPVVHTAHAMGLVPYGYHFQQAPPGMGLHSNATVLMPNLSEAEIRARLATSQAIPTANAAAMPLQHASGWPGAHPWYGQQPTQQEYDDDQEYESDGEVNVLAVIIFGTLSVTALGGLGMLILLILTTSPPMS